MADLADAALAEAANSSSAGEHHGASGQDTDNKFQKAISAFAGDNEQLYPWYLTAEDAASSAGETVLDAGKAHNRSGSWQRQATQIQNGAPRLARNRGCLVHLSGDIRFIFTQAQLRQDLMTSKALLSPTDPKCKRTNDLDSRDGKMAGWGRSWWNSAFQTNHMSWFD